MKEARVSFVGVSYAYPRRVNARLKVTPVNANVHCVRPMLMFLVHKLRAQTTKVASFWRVDLEQEVVRALYRKCPPIPDGPMSLDTEWNFNDRVVEGDEAAHCNFTIQATPVSVGSRKFDVECDGFGSYFGVVAAFGYLVRLLNKQTGGKVLGDDLFRLIQQAADNEANNHVVFTWRD